MASFWWTMIFLPSRTPWFRPCFSAFVGSSPGSTIAIPSASEFAALLRYCV
jgi:hypothetical protein